ncbi:MAG: protein O-mannosyl-transferase family, partial [Polyangiaceae bacterium]
MVTAAALWGVPHPPGYPLFTAIGHVFAALPLFTIPWRVHLTSALFHGGTVAAVIAATFTLTRDRVAAIAAGVALGLCGSFLLGSLYAEVFPLNDLLFACVLALGLSVRSEPDLRARRKRLRLLAVCAGIAAGHHLMFALAVPALAVLVYAPARESLRGAPGKVARLALAFLAPVGVAYLLIPLAASRSPYLSWGGVHDVDSFAQLVTRGDYGGLLHATRHPSAGSGWTRVRAFSELLLQGAGVVVLLGATAGVAVRLRREPAVGAALLLAVLVPGPVFAWLNALDVTAPGRLAYFERFTTMTDVSVALAFGAGVQAARAW